MRPRHGALDDAGDVQTGIAASGCGHARVKRARFRSRSRSRDELQLRACHADVCANHVSELTQRVVLHLLFARSQIPNVWSALQEQQLQQEEEQAQAQEQQPVLPKEERSGVIPASRRAPRVSLADRHAHRRVLKYFDALTALLAGMADTISRINLQWSQSRPTHQQQFRCRRVLLIFGPSPISPLELYELQFSRVAQSGCLLDHGAALTTNTNAEDTERKLIDKLSRQILRCIVQDVQPRRDLRCTKLWILVEIPTYESHAAGLPLTCAAGFAVKRNVDVALLKRRAESVHCEIKIGPDESRLESSPESSGGGLKQGHEHDARAEMERCPVGSVWAQSIGSVAALRAQEWSAAGYQ